MRRRDVLGGGSAALALASASAHAQPYDPDAWKRELSRLRGAFPYPVEKVNGANALARWGALKTRAGITPIVIGGEEDFDRIAEGVWGYPETKDVAAQSAAILSRADRLKHPASIFDLGQKRFEENQKYVRDMKNAPDDQLPKISNLTPDGKLIPRSPADIRNEIAEMADSDRYPEAGPWPADNSSGSTGLSVAYDILTQKPFDPAYIVLLPTSERETAPAFLNWGGWNDCPLPEYHVAALRSWRDRYGAEIVGMSGDVMNVLVKRRPQTRDEALALAREQYDYCYDIVEQGVGTISNLAATLMADDWWYFWWD